MCAMESSGVVYTAITNNYDFLHDPKYVSENLDYVCFYDQSTQKTDIWNTVKLSRSSSEPRKVNRKIKILPHEFLEGYDYSIYLDGNIVQNCDLDILADKYLREHLIACPRHVHRSCLYEEAKECLSRKKSSANKIVSQILKYKQEGYPQKNGLSTNSIIFRRHNHPKVIKVMQEWWREIENHSIRDQISFNYVMWKSDIDLKYIDEHYRNDDSFFRRKHNPGGLSQLFWYLREYYFEKVKEY